MQTKSGGDVRQCHRLCGFVCLFDFGFVFLCKSLIRKGLGEPQPAVGGRSDFLVHWRSTQAVGQHSSGARLGRHTLCSAPHLLSAGLCSAWCKEGWISAEVPQFP